MAKSDYVLPIFIIFIRAVFVIFGISVLFVSLLAFLSQIINRVGALVIGVVSSFIIVFVPIVVISVGSIEDSSSRISPYNSVFANRQHIANKRSSLQNEGNLSIIKNGNDILNQNNFLQYFITLDKNNADDINVINEIQSIQNKERNSFRNFFKYIDITNLFNNGIFKVGGISDELGTSNSNIVQFSNSELEKFYVINIVQNSEIIKYLFALNATNKTNSELNIVPKIGRSIGASENIENDFLNMYKSTIESTFIDVFNTSNSTDINEIFQNGIAASLSNLNRANPINSWNFNFNLSGSSGFVITNDSGLEVQILDDNFVFAQLMFAQVLNNIRFNRNFTLNPQFESNPRIGTLNLIPLNNQNAVFYAESGIAHSPVPPTIIYIILGLSGLLISMYVVTIKKIVAN
ncbi:hypothetical protein [Mycoplasma testudineum]|nr:hypothetical protein [Mycoplasma testudineum]OYD26634.1 hypothetical protein CG473_03310 [Mycoplasma testudineum]